MHVRLRPAVRQDHLQPHLRECIMQGPRSATEPAGARQEIPRACGRAGRGDGKLEEATMILSGRVVKIESAEVFTDKVQRAYVKVAEADGSMYAELRLLNVEHWAVDQVL